MCDLFLVLAQTEHGAELLRGAPGAAGRAHNPFALQRLKDKLGNRSNASSEVEFAGTVGWLVGEPGRGVRTIIDMVTMTRLDCVIGSAAVQRAALTQALHHIDGRSAFGRRLSDQPLMQEVVADLAIEVAAAAALFVRLADAVDRGETGLLRLAVAAGKFWICKRTGTVVGEALECLGGAGYVEESPLPRYFRESPLNSIWEGSGNVIALDVLRAAGREPGSVQALFDELALTAGADPPTGRRGGRAGQAAGRAGRGPGRGRPVGARRWPACWPAPCRVICWSGRLPIRPAQILADSYLETRLAGPVPAVAADRPALGAQRTSSLLEQAAIASH